MVDMGFQLLMEEPQFRLSHMLLLLLSRFSRVRLGATP